MLLNQKYPAKKHLTWIDQSKGIAILGVVIFHFFQNFPNRINLVNILDRNGAKIGFAAVDIFFMISGFNIGYSLAQKNNNALLFIKLNKIINSFALLNQKTP
jgi:peptidoglycan/LPS O-acetylase OafA/YrhL